MGFYPHQDLNLARLPIPPFDLPRSKDARGRPATSAARSSHRSRSPFALPRSACDNRGLSDPTGMVPRRLRRAWFGRCLARSSSPFP